MLETYGYHLVGDVWLNERARKALSSEVERDSLNHPSQFLGMHWLRSKLEERVPPGEFRFYANNPPTDVSKVAELCRVQDLKAVVVYRPRSA